MVTRIPSGESSVSGGSSEMWAAGFDVEKAGLPSVDDSDVQSIWKDELILYPIAKDLNSASIFPPDKEKLLLAGFDEPESAADDFFELLGKIDAQRENEASDDRSRALDPLSVLEQEGRLAGKCGPNA